MSCSQPPEWSGCRGSPQTVSGFFPETLHHRKALFGRDSVEQSLRVPFHAAATSTCKWLPRAHMGGNRHNVLRVAPPQDTCLLPAAGGSLFPPGAPSTAGCKHSLSPPACATCLHGQLQEHLGPGNTQGSAHRPAQDTSAMLRVMKTMSR